MDASEYVSMYEKPGNKKKEKVKSKSSKRSLRIGDKKDCTHCGEITGKERMCHAESTEIKMLDGGGIMGSTINDKLSARLCFDCDQLLSPKPKPKDRLIHEVYWWRAIAKTHLL